MPPGMRAQGAEEGPQAGDGLDAARGFEAAGKLAKALDIYAATGKESDVREILLSPSLFAILCITLIVLDSPYGNTTTWKT